MFPKNKGNANDKTFDIIMIDNINNIDLLGMFNFFIVLKNSTKSLL